jgi:hypothetical protein
MMYSANVPAMIGEMRRAARPSAAQQIIPAMGIDRVLPARNAAWSSMSGVSAEAVM